MKLAIHHRKNSFSDYWIDFCVKNQIPYKLVDAYGTDIVKELEDCDAFLWHHHQTSFKDVLTAKRILFAVEQSGLIVFPDFNTGWHFDDKVAQKYLLEAIGAPYVKSYVFYSKKQAVNWSEKTTFPKVFKLAGGASGSNVLLAETKNSAQRLISKAFGRGFSQYNAGYRIKEEIRLMKLGKGNYKSLLKGLVRVFIPTNFSKMKGREKGYAYFQDFIPNSDFDIRVVVVDNKAFALKQFNRKNDFRASNSGHFVYERNEIDIRTVEIALDVSKTLKSASTSYDFVFDEEGNPFIIEMGYGFINSVYEKCPGYWDAKLDWHEGAFNPQHWIIKRIIEQIKNK